MTYEELLDRVVESEESKNRSAQRQIDAARTKKSRAAQKYQDDMKSANEAQSRAQTAFSKSQ